MELILEKWRRFLKEEAESPLPFRIFCDMDGVLVDLVGGILEKANADVKDPKLRSAVLTIIGNKEVVWQQHKKNPKLKKGLSFIFKLLNDKDETGFWRDLPAMPDAQELWGFISQYDPFILSAPWEFQGSAQISEQGKENWLANSKNINPTPPDHRIILTQSKHLYAINKETGEQNVLIDDMDKYIGPWEQAGGIAIKHTSAASSIEQLKKLIEEKQK
tara:strand:+ start:161 stop:814 length:654 start_codon:yes stop_codon:yes gene_type:complete